MSTAAIIVIGDEILSGKFREENAAWLIGELRALGVALRRVDMIPDDEAEIAATVAAAAARVDHVFTSGGVGPTHDDVTMKGVARAFGLALSRHAQLERELRAWYGEHIAPANLRMADVPAGAEMVGADHPSWPVTRVRNVYILPGVPIIFRRKFDSIRERFRDAAFHVRRLYCLADEGALAPALDQVVAAFPQVGIGSYPRFDAIDYKVMVTLEAKDRDLVRRARDALVEALPEGALKREDEG